MRITFENEGVSFFDKNKGYMCESTEKNVCLTPTDDLLIKRVKNIPKDAEFAICIGRGTAHKVLRVGDDTYLTPMLGNYDKYSEGYIEEEW